MGTRFSNVASGPDEINERLARIMCEAFSAVWQVARIKRYHYALLHLLWLVRVFLQPELRGLYPHKDGLGVVAYDVSKE